jgi:hypothetical protein
MSKQYTIEIVTANQIGATDLQQELADDSSAVCFVIRYADGDGYSSRAAEGIYYASAGRMGIAEGGDGTWADVASLESGIEMYVNDADAWELAN